MRDTYVWHLHVWVYGNSQSSLKLLFNWLKAFCTSKYDIKMIYLCCSFSFSLLLTFKSSCIYKRQHNMFLIIIILHIITACPCDSRDSPFSTNTVQNRAHTKSDIIPSWCIIVIGWRWFVFEIIANWATYFAFECTKYIACVIGYGHRFRYSNLTFVIKLFSILFKKLDNFFFVYLIEIKLYVHISRRKAKKVNNFLFNFDFSTLAIPISGFLLAIWT